MNKLLSVSLTVAILAITFSSCKKQHDDNVKASGQLDIEISAILLKSALESAADSGFSTGITSVVVTIKDLQDNIIKSSEKIELYNMNGYYISKPISLTTGSYKLTQFLVLNGKNQVLYASPLKDSPKKNLVANPLPIFFTVAKDIVTKLTPEVLSTTESTPSDFGYNTFSFDIAETFDFLVGAFVYNDSGKNFELTTANIKILNEATIVYEGALEAKQSGTVQLSNYDSLGITNKITLPERYNSYILEITKPGYKTYRDTLTKEELRLYNRSEDNGPLVVILEKEEVPREVVDIDGNTYHTIIIGTQVWLLENLKTKHFNNGDAIPQVEDGPTWWALTTCAFCEYGTPDEYGRLYNWYAVMDARGICPPGYHIPTNAEWQTLVNYLGGESVAGGKMKEEGLTHWKSPNFGATNSSGFTAVASGYRHGGGTDPYYNYKANLTWTSVWWTSTPNPGNDRVYVWSIQYTSDTIENGGHPYKEDGFSVRCLKD